MQSPSTLLTEHNVVLVRLLIMQSAEGTAKDLLKRISCLGWRLGSIGN